MRRVSYSVLVLTTCLITTTSLQARDYVLGWGGRVGAALDPEQVYVGFHLDLGEIAERVRLQPNIEIGFGDGRTLVAINPEVFYLFKPHDRWTPYAGGGLGINIVNWDHSADMDDMMETQIGLNLLGGVETKISDRAKFFGEIKFGVGDSPDAKLSVGLTFLM